VDPEIRRKAKKRLQKWGMSWFRNFDGYWYVTIQGERRKLAKGEENREQALAEWHRLMALAGAEEKKADNPLWVIFEKFLEYTQREHPVCYPHYKNTLQVFKDEHPDLRVRDLKPAVINDWLHRHPTWNQSTRRENATVIVTALNWAAKPEQQIIDRNPIAGMRRPQCRSRGAEAVVNPKDFDAILQAATPAMQDALAFLRATGTRPSNLARIHAESIDVANRCVRLTNHKTYANTGRPLVIPLTQAALDVLLRLAAKYPEGPLFRTRHGLPMTGGRLSCAIGDIKRRKGLSLTGNPIAYGLRHTLATELPSKDMPDAKVAAKFLQFLYLFQIHPISFTDMGMSVNDPSAFCDK
jgi:integrase